MESLISASFELNPINRILIVEGAYHDATLDSLFSELEQPAFQIDWLTGDYSYSDALAAVAQQQHDVYFVDGCPAIDRALSFVQTALTAGCLAPIILLVNQDDRQLEHTALTLGAADCLPKPALNPFVLQRAIRQVRERRQLLTTLQQVVSEKEQLSLAIAHVKTGISITDPRQPNNPTIFVNPAFTALTGYSASEIIGKSCSILQGPQTDPAAIAKIRTAIHNRESLTCTLLNYRKDGTAFWNQLTINPVFNPEGELISFIGLQLDVTAHQQAEAALRESEERYALAVQGANDGIWDWNLKTDRVYYSPRWKSMLGYAESEIGNSLDEWLTRIHPDDLYWVKRQLTAHLEGLTPHFESEYRMQSSRGDYYWMLSRGLVVRDSEGNATRMAGSQTDISARKQAEEKLVHETLHDALTGLPNRALLMERLRHAIQLAHRNPSYGFAVLFTDLDRFKVINDSLGHMVGDRLLIEMARRLSACLRPTDMIARLGGDEFVILIEDARDEVNAALVADRIRQELSLPFDIDGREVFTTASIGIVLGNTQFDRPEDLLRDADTAMYRAKAHGRGRCEIFHPGMHTRAVTLLELETDLRRAIERQELRLHYQPIISLRNSQIIGFEALLRWQHPQRGMVSPIDFIPIAEDTGLIVPIGSWVLHQSCQQMRIWQQQFPHHPLLCMCVNLSSKQFTADLITEVSQILQNTHLNARYLKLEMTESILVENADLAAVTLNKLQQLGVRLAIDDFGTGYSSLSYLHRFPIDTLKIDRSFVNKLDIDGEQVAIVRTIMTLAWNLGMEVVAEGVETNKQLAQLRSLKCEYGQGYLFSKPQAPEAIEELLASTEGVYPKAFTP